LELGGAVLGVSAVDEIGDIIYKDVFGGDNFQTKSVK
jgi:hypothetical protein